LAPARASGQPKPSGHSVRKRPRPDRSMRGSSLAIRRRHSCRELVRPLAHHGEGLEISIIAKPPGPTVPNRGVRNAPRRNAPPHPDRGCRPPALPFGTGEPVNHRSLHALIYIQCGMISASASARLEFDRLALSGGMLRASGVSPTGPFASLHSRIVTGKEPARIISHSAAICAPAHCAASLEADT